MREKHKKDMDEWMKLISGEEEESPSETEEEDDT